MCAYCPKSDRFILLHEETVNRIPKLEPCKWSSPFVMDRGTMAKVDYPTFITRECIGVQHRWINVKYCKQHSVDVSEAQSYIVTYINKILS